MTKIRELIEECILPEPGTNTRVNRNIAKSISEDIVRCLASQGVMQTEESELPENPYIDRDAYGNLMGLDTEKANAYGGGQDSLLKAGYRYCVPLKEK